MNAKEMFEEWDYKVIKEWDVKVPKTGKVRKGITYQNDDGGYIRQIMFIPTFKSVRFIEYETYNDNKPQGQFSVYDVMFDIIHQQMKELGWIE
jgi:hypothetical protein